MPLFSLRIVRRSTALRFPIGYAARGKVQECSRDSHYANSRLGSRSQLSMSSSLFWRHHPRLPISKTSFQLSCRYLLLVGESSKRSSWIKCRMQIQAGSLACFRAGNSGRGLEQEGAFADKFTPSMPSSDGVLMHSSQRVCRMDDNLHRVLNSK